MRTAAGFLLVSCWLTAALAHCEQRYSAAPPAGPESVEPAPSASGGGIDALLAKDEPSAQGGPSLVHDMTVVLCSARPEACPSADGQAPASGSYGVAFGSGSTVIRTRGQVTAEVYKELEDRTKAGERLDAELFAGGNLVSPGRTFTGETAGGSNNPFSSCAFHLVELVDEVGELTLDRLPGSTEKGCLVSVARFADAGGQQCLVLAPEAAKRLNLGRGFQW